MSRREYSGWDRLEDRIDHGAGNWADKPARTTVKWGLVAVAIFVVISVVGGFIALAGGWFSGTADLVSFDNFEEQHGQLWEDWESMEAIQINVCIAEEALDAAIERGANETTISTRETQLLAQQQLYQGVAADYDARMANFFETLSGFVAPAELPDKAPLIQPC